MSDDPNRTCIKDAMKKKKYLKKKLNMVVSCVIIFFFFYEILPPKHYRLAIILQYILGTRAVRLTRSLTTVNVLQSLVKNK